MNRTDRPGYILVLALMMIAATMVLVTQLFERGMTYVAFMRTALERQKAQQLALGGIQLAMSQLTPKMDKNKDTDQAFIRAVVPTLNRWQKFELKKETEGLSGEIKICITSEEGKVNLNLLDQQGPSTKALQAIFAAMKPFTGDKDLYPAFQEFIKKRKKGLDDVTQLLEIKEFALFEQNIFYEPPIQGETKRPIYLTDIFTIFGTQMGPQPWFFSDSLNAITGLPRAAFGDVSARTQEVEQWVKQVKPTMQWPQDWNTMFKPIYGVDYTGVLKSIEPLLPTKFESKVFSVISYGSTGRVTQKVFAILRRDDTQASAWNIIRIYWI